MNAVRADSIESPPAPVQRGADLSHNLDRWDVVALLGLTAVAFILRFFSPITPTFFVHPTQGPLIS